MQSDGLTFQHNYLAMRIPMTFSVGAGAAGLGAVLLAVAPALTREVFIGGAARVGSVFSRAAAVRMDEGWALVIAGQPVLVTDACSATDFYLMTTALLGWHLAKKMRWPLAVVCAVAGAIPLTVLVNALRIVAVAQAHRWVIPRMPAAYEPFLHMLTGAAVFLPALIVLNLIFEYHHGRSSDASRA